MSRTLDIDPPVTPAGAFPLAHRFLAEVWDSLGHDPEALRSVTFSGEGDLRAGFAVADFAAATFAAAGAAVGELLAGVGARPARIDVDRRLAAGWFDVPMAPTRPLVTDEPHGIHAPWMAEFQTADDRWLRLQASYPSLREAVFRALGCAPEMAAVADAIRSLDGEEAEAGIVAAGGAAALARSLAEWRAHPQGVAAAAEPIVARRDSGEWSGDWRPTPGRPLAGLRVLDLTRVVAGPMGTRFLAACGAEVLRLTDPDSDEIRVGGRANDVVIGKRWALLDLDTPAGRDRFLELLATADVLVHSHRPDVLERLGIGEAVRQEVRPGLVDVGLRAYGWTGPWSTRRGFDTLVQYSSGIAFENTEWARRRPDVRTPMNVLGSMLPADHPHHLPVEALDFGTGYLIAATAISGLARRQRTGRGSFLRLSLARNAKLLTDAGEVPDEPSFPLPVPGPLEARVYATTNAGPSRHLRFPVAIEGNPLYWERPAEDAGSSTPTWSMHRSA